MELLRINEEGIVNYVLINKEYEVVVLPSKYFRTIAQKNIRYSKQSVMQYAKVLKYFCAYLEDIYTAIPVDISLESLSGLIVSDYLKQLKEEGKAATTIRNREAVIKDFLSWLTTEEAGHIRENNTYPTKRYRSANPDRGVPKYLTIEEIKEFILTLHDENQRCLAHFMYDSGLRVSEVIKLKIKDLPNINEYDDTTAYFDIDVNGSKGRGGNIKKRKTFITRAVLQRINRLHKQNKMYKKLIRKNGQETFCFLNTHGEPLTDNAIRNLFYKAAKRKGLDTTKYSPHKFRHSFAISVLLSEFDSEYLNKLVIAKEALGHANIKTTEIYSRISPAAIKHLQAVNQAHDIQNRFEQAQMLYDETYLPQKMHSEKRGRNKL